MSPAVRVMLIAGVAVAALLGGCASNASQHWAQTSPVITPEPNGATIISLGAFEKGS